MISKDVDRLKIAQEFMREHLPFFINSDFTACNAHKFYPWQRDYLLVNGRSNPAHRLQFLTAANQIGKSSVQIIKCLNMAMRQDLWPYWFGKKKPTTFFYLYPSYSLFETEFSEKWTKCYLSRGPMKDDPRYGWSIHKNEKGQIDAIVFRSGVTCYYRHYSQSPTVLQASTLDAVFLDEETPEAHYDELMVRTQKAAAQGSGYVSMVFTATLGQSYLFNCMEMQGSPQETFKGAWKRQISVYDCLTYCDGTPSDVWTKDYIEKELIPKYRNQREINKRILGRFQKDTGLIYEEFQRERNTEPRGETDTKGWRTYVGIDYGAGGDWGHSSAIVVVKVDPTYSKARVVKVWNSQKQRMTQSDLLMQYKEIASDLGYHYAFADWGAVDLFTLAAREGVRLEKAEKSHEIGTNLLNTLFKEAQLKIVTNGDTGSSILIQELQTVSEDKNKRHRIDDTVDALRYAISLCPMRLTALKLAEEKKKEDVTKMNPRLAFYKGLDRKSDPMRDTDDEFESELFEAIDEFEGLL